MKYIISFILLVFAISKSSGQQAAHLNLQNGLALQGYDPVGYISSQQAIKGKREISYRYEGATYYFASERNRQAFVKNASAYTPQYGGWCAYAMGATGEKVEIDPETFKVVDGKLYLFYNRFFNNTLLKWNKEESSLKSRADQNWKTLLQTKP